MKMRSSGPGRVPVWWAAAAAILLGIGLAGCGAAVPQAGAAHKPALTKAPTTTPVRTPAPKDPAAPAFSVKDLAGAAISVPNGAPTLVYFMSAICGSCIQGEQQLAQLAAQLPGSVRLLSLDVTPQYDTAQSLAAVAQETGAHWPQAFSTSAILQAYHVTQLDQAAVVTASGHVLYNGPLPSNSQLLSLLHRAGT